MHRKGVSFFSGKTITEIPFYTVKENLYNIDIHSHGIHIMIGKNFLFRLELVKEACHASKPSYCEFRNH